MKELDKLFGNIVFTIAYGAYGYNIFRLLFDVTDKSTIYIIMSKTYVFMFPLLIIMLLLLITRINVWRIFFDTIFFEEFEYWR